MNAAAGVVDIKCSQEERKYMRLGMYTAPILGGRRHIAVIRIACITCYVSILHLLSLTARHPRTEQGREG
jgi:hypothetical protein